MIKPHSLVQWLNVIRGGNKLGNVDIVLSNTPIEHCSVLPLLTGSSTINGRHQMFQLCSNPRTTRCCLLFSKNKHQHHTERDMKSSNYFFNMERPCADKQMTCNGQIHFPNKYGSLPFTNKGTAAGSLISSEKNINPSNH